MKYEHIISQAMSTPWAIRPDKLNAIISLLALRAAGGELSAEEIAVIKEEPREPYLIDYAEPKPVEADAAGETELRILPADCDQFEVRSFASVMGIGGEVVSRSTAPSIAVLPLFGTISHRMGMMSEMSGGISTERFSQWLKAALNDSSVKSIVIDVDSPGGTVNGVPELADEIFQGRATKPIVAVANAQAASAAYFLAAQASELVVTPSGEVGSIGVFAAHQDISKALEAEGAKITLISAGKYKTEANPYEPLSEEARAALQDKVNAFYEVFIGAVAKGRNVTTESVRSGFGQGRMLQAEPARRAGMVDRVATIARTLKRMGAKPKQASIPDRMKQGQEQPPAQQEQPAHLVNLSRRRRELQLY